MVFHIRIVLELLLTALLDAAGSRFKFLRLLADSYAFTNLEAGSARFPYRSLALSAFR
jgi:hypothetical protein